MCPARPQPPRAPGPTVLCIPKCLVPGFSGGRMRKERVCPSLLSSVPLLQLQLLGFCFGGTGSEAVMWFSWCPGFPGLSLEKREDFLTASGSLPSFVMPPPNQTASAEACPSICSPAPSGLCVLTAPASGQASAGSPLSQPALSQLTALPLVHPPSCCPGSLLKTSLWGHPSA